MQDVADDFVENVTAFACELAKHRESTTLEAKDIQLALGTLGQHLHTALPRPVHTLLLA